METSALQLASAAATAFTQRQNRARAAVAARKMPRADAESRLLPWLAIACLAGADLPELEDELAQLRETGTDGEPIFSDAQARALLADRICPRSRWAGLLGRARDDALRHADTFSPAGATRRSPQFDAERQAALDAGRALMLLANHFAADPNGRHPVPPYQLLPDSQKEAA